MVIVRRYDDLSANGEEECANAMLLVAGRPAVALLQSEAHRMVRGYTGTDHHRREQQQ